MARLQDLAEQLVSHRLIRRILKIQSKIGAGGSLSTQALIGKSLDLLQTGGPPFLNTYLRGARLKIIGGVTNILPYVLISGGRITNSEQLRGKKIGISRFGSNTDFVVRLALAQLGLTPGDVTVLQIGGSESRLVALKAGTIDATVLSPEEALAAQKAGLNTLLDFVAKGVEFPHVTIVAREEYLQTQALLVRRFMTAYVGEPGVSDLPNSTNSPPLIIRHCTQVCAEALESDTTILPSSPELQPATDRKLESLCFPRRTVFLPAGHSKLKKASLS